MWHEVNYIREDEKLDRVLAQFRNKRRHLFIVLDQFNGVEGIITLEDVLEEIVGEIVDEYDLMVDMRVVN